MIKYMIDLIGDKSIIVMMALCLFISIVTIISNNPEKIRLYTLEAVDFLSFDDINTNFWF